ncbi:phosphoribosylformylglycinamidine cyclo-ligase [Cohnella sp. GbtcB17]|uniref:phosphoribosylformylglycinamidine cyclo-ligase n=1 Tax=Cohnella sp. GbtcB17 TaxID=2824762 RepID=UPI001C305BBD|nr:phosphoribosylformylglycinamidine cyclo-ligase [Cohnella sp. GbtcB17]
MDRENVIPLTYRSAGVDRHQSELAKQEMGGILNDSGDSRVLNGLGAFASLFVPSFPGYREPILAFKTEEPGTKQQLAFAHDRIESLCEDLLHHLANDMLAMGAVPVVMQDAILCGKLDREIVVRIVRSLADGCRRLGFTLSGGETSEQPGVIPEGTYLLTASAIGVVERSAVIDGSAILPGDIVLALESNGLHTNGYSLVRKLLQQVPQLAERKVGGDTFLNAVLLPHRCYLPALVPWLGNGNITGLAHITGGGLSENLNRIIPNGLSAKVSLPTLRIPEIFRIIRSAASLSDEDMIRTFNLGVGMVAVVRPDAESAFLSSCSDLGYEGYPIGVIERGSEPVRFVGDLRW